MLRVKLFHLQNNKKDINKQEVSEMSEPYKVTKQAMKELRQRYEKKLKSTFPEGVPPEIKKRIEREEAALMSCPNTYGLLVADEVIKTLGNHNFRASVEGQWSSSYLVWLLDLQDMDPNEARMVNRYFGIEDTQFIRDNCMLSPIEIDMSLDYGKSLCRDLIEIVAHKYYFWVSECPDQKDTFRLIDECYRDDDIYAKYAPTIKIVKY